MPNNFYRFFRGYKPVSRGFQQVRTRQLDTKIATTSAAVAATTGAFGPIQPDSGSGGGGGGGGGGTIYSITFAPNAGAPPTPAPSGDGMYLLGAAVAISASPNISGFNFTNWSGSTDAMMWLSDAFSPNAVVNVQGNFEYTANYV